MNKSRHVGAAVLASESGVAKRGAGADRVYIAYGYTDLRRGIDGLAELMQQQFRLDPFSST